MFYENIENIHSCKIKKMQQAQSPILQPNLYL